MALPEDDVEEVDPEPALARILDHEHDAIVVGPGLRPGLATTELVRSLLPIAGETDAAADRARRRGAPLDGHDGRLVDGRPAAGRADPARRGVRAAAGGQRRRDRPTTATSRATTRRAWRPPSMPPRPGARSSSSRAPGRSSPRRTGSAAIAPFENPALATGGTGDVLAGAIGVAARAGPRAVRRGAARASTSTGWRATPSASGSATPGCSRRTCPTASPSRASGSSAVAERRTAGKRLGFAARESDGPSGPASPVPRRHPGSRATFAEPRVAGHGPVPARPPIEQRLADGRAAAAAADGLARDRPRRAARQPRGRCASSPGRASRSGRWSRPTPTATARSRSPSRSRRPAPTGSASRPSTRRSSCATAASRRRSSCSIRCRRPGPARPRASGSRWRSATPPGVAGARAGRRRHRPGATAGCRARGRDRARPGRVRRDRAGRRGARARGGSGHRADRAVDPFPGRRGRRPSRTPRSTGSRRRPRPLTRGRDRPAAAPRRGERRAADRRRRGLRRRPARAGDLRPRPRRARRGRRRPRPARRRLRPVMSLHRPAGPRRRPPGGLGRQLRADVPDRAPEPDRDPAARLRRRLVAALSNRAEALVRGRARAARRQRRDGRGHGRRDRRPGRAGRRDDEFVLLGRPETSAITAEELARERTTNTWEVVTGMARRLPRVYHAAAGPVGLRTLTER